jgi:PTS system nitrogen regulatory IIA component
MKISEILTENQIIEEIDATDKTSVVRELAKGLARGDRNLQPNLVARVLMDRERIQSTAIDAGIAIPHGKSAMATRLTACLARSRDGIDFESSDGGPTHLFFALVAPENSKGTHLKALARVSKLLGNPAHRRKLMEAPDAETMFRVISDAEAEAEGEGGAETKG